MLGEGRTWPGQRQLSSDPRCLSVVSYSSAARPWPREASRETYPPRGARQLVSSCPVAPPRHLFAVAEEEEEEEEGPGRKAGEGGLPGLHIACGRRTCRLEEKRARSAVWQRRLRHRQTLRPLRRPDGGGSHPWAAPGSSSGPRVQGPATPARPPRLDGPVRWAGRVGRADGAHPRGSQGAWGRPAPDATRGTWAAGSTRFTCKSRLLRREEETLKTRTRDCT